MLYQCPLCKSGKVIIMRFADTEYPLYSVKINDVRKALAACADCGNLFLVKPVYKKDKGGSQ